MTRFNRLTQSTNRFGRYILATSTAMAMVASLTLSISSTAIAQDRASQAEAHGAVFPSTASMQAGVASKVEQGKLTQEQADMILRVHARLVSGIDTGRITTSEALGIMEERSIAIYEGEGNKSKLDAKRRYDEAVAKMTEMVENGEITREQMQQRLDRMKKEMGRERTITQKDYDKAVAEMTEMVKNGEITREQMQQRLDRMKKMMAKTKSFTQKEYDEAVAKMTEMVKAGEITRTQMQQRLDRMKKMMAKDKAITREDIAKAKAEMQKMVDAGKITEEQMRQRLGEMRRMMKTQAGKLDARAEYKRMERRMKMAVDSGKMTREEADQKLQAFGRELRMKMAGKSKGNGNEMSDECRELGAKLRQAVADGEITSEDAKAAWELECGKNDR